MIPWIKEYGLYHSDSKKHDQPFVYAWVWGLLVLGILFRIIIMYKSQFAIGFDEAHYLRLAGCFKEQGFSGLLHPYWPPFFPFIIAVTSTIFGDLVFTARIINILFGSGLMLLIYYFAKQLFNQKEVFLSVLFVAVYPPLVYGSTNTMPETLYTILGILGILIAWKGLVSHRYLFGFLAGLLWGMNYLIKPEGIGYLLVFAAFGGLWFISDLFYHSSKKRIFFILAALIGFVIMAGPYLNYLHNETGKWSLSTKGEVNQQLSAAVRFETGGIKDPFYHLSSDNRFLPYDMAYHHGNLNELNQFQEGNKRIVKIPISSYLKKYGQNVYKMLRYAVPHVFTVPILLFWTLGFFNNRYNPDQWKMILFLVSFVFFFWFIVIPIFHVNDRYLAPLFPLAFIWVGRGCLIFYQWIIENIENISLRKGKLYQHSHKMGMIIILLCALFSFLPELVKIVAVPKYDRDMWAQPIGLKKAGLWLKQNTDDPPLLMSLNKAVDFYAGQYNLRKGASFSYDSIERNIAYANHRDVKYLVFSERYLSWFPNLEPLIDYQNLPGDLRLIYKEQDPSGIHTVIYTIINKGSKSKGL